MCISKFEIKCLGDCEFARFLVKRAAPYELAHKTPIAAFSDWLKELASQVPGHSTTPSNISIVVQNVPN